PWSGPLARSRWSLRRAVPGNESPLPRPADGADGRRVSRMGRGGLIAAAAAAALTLLVQPAAAASPPPNDDFASAEVISGVDGRVSGTTLGATTLPDDPTYADLHAHGGTVWYQWTAPRDGVVVFETVAADPIGIVPESAALYGDAPDSGHL